jgi:hypothetical protein
MSAAFRAQSVCECQALLEAELDERHQILTGSARKPGSERETAPANSVKGDGDRFDIVWQCPMCGRNTLRSFSAGALRRAGAA